MLDFSNMPLLVAPRRKRILAERYDRERLANIKFAKRKRNHPKRHGMKKEEVEVKRRRTKQRRERLEKQTEARTAYLAAVRAYWKGDRADHPAL